jgi:hypothetical protein
VFGGRCRLGPGLRILIPAAADDAEVFVVFHVMDPILDFRVAGSYRPSFRGCS